MIIHLLMQLIHSYIINQKTFLCNQIPIQIPVLDGSGEVGGLTGTCPAGSILPWINIWNQGVQYEVILHLREAPSFWKGASFSPYVQDRQWFEPPLISECKLWRSIQIY
jgi:hypothetical protein